MAINDIMTAITTVGFPIVCCLALAWYVKDQTEKNRAQLNALTEQHRMEISSVTEALNNNTLALQRLCDKMERSVDDELHG